LHHLLLAIQSLVPGAEENTDQWQQQFITTRISDVLLEIGRVSVTVLQQNLSATVL